MRSILTVTAPATDFDLTTLARVKSELNITGTDSDTILGQKIEEASDDISSALGFVVAKETVSEDFWYESGDAAPEYLVLNRTPIRSIASVTIDGVVIDSSLYRLDAKIGQIFALDASGYPFAWLFCKNIVIAYDGGYILPAESASDLPSGIQGACVDLVSSYWLSRGRDAAVKSVDIPGVRTVDYWVGAVGEEGELPPSVQAKLMPYRRVNV